jgi:hypothetical protein
MGGEKYSPYENTSDPGIKDIRLQIFILYKIVAIVSLIFYAIVFIRKREKRGGFKKAYNHMLNSSVFIYLQKPSRGEDSDVLSPLERTGGI